MKRRSVVPLTVSVIMVLGAWLFADRPPLWNESGTAMEGLSDLQNIEQLRTQFNADAGLVRLILVLSPT